MSISRSFEAMTARIKANPDIDLWVLIRAATDVEVGHMSGKIVLEKRDCWTLIGFELEADFLLFKITMAIPIINLTAHQVLAQLSQHKKAWAAYYWFEEEKQNHYEKIIERARLALQAEIKMLFEE